MFFHGCERYKYPNENKMVTIVVLNKIHAGINWNIYTLVDTQELYCKCSKENSKKYRRKDMKGKKKREKAFKFQ